MNIERTSGPRRLSDAMAESTARLTKKIEAIAAEQRKVDALPPGKEKERRNKLLRSERAIVARRQSNLKECLVEARKQHYA